MGRQVNFWMLERDEEEFVRFVLSNPGVVMLSYLASGPKPRVITELPHPSEQWWWAVYFWNQAFPHKHRLVEVVEGASQGQYALLADRGPIIEFHRSIPSESGELSRGRIWTAHRDVDFLRWYGQIADWIRKRHRKVRKEGNAWLYAGPHAHEWSQAGGVLSR